MPKTIRHCTSNPAPKEINSRIRPGAKAFIVHKNKILLIYEKLPDGEIICDFPGGGMEYGETIEETLKREVKEEVGLEVEIVKPVGNWSFILVEHQIQILCMGYQCKINGSSKLDFSHNPAEENIFKAIWQTKEELLNNDKLTNYSEICPVINLLEI
jgi:ADP-ribose pyrophosphatase YjhB (NUDIX family)